MNPAPPMEGDWVRRRGWVKRPFAGITIAFISGILGEELLNIPVFYVFLFALVSLFLSALFIKSKYVFLLYAISGFLFLGAFAYKTSVILPKNHIKNIVSVNRQLPSRILAQGRILNRPSKRITYFNQEKTEFLLDIKAIFVDKNWHDACGILSAQVTNPRLNFRYADEIVLEGELSLADSASNPGQFDYRKYLERKRQFFILRVGENDFSKIAGRRRPNALKLWGYGASERIEALIDNNSPGMEGSILNAILLGQRREIDDDINDNFINTGTIHILSISGLHVGLLAFIFMLLFKMLRFPFSTRAFILTFLLILYCAMVDNRPPVIRSTIMILVFLFGRVVKKQHDPLNSLAVSAFAILLFNPQDLFDIGFQLSFLTMGSIIYFPPKIEEIFSKLPQKRASLYFIRAMAVSFSAWLGSAPFIARYFNIVSPVTIFANILVVPWMFVVLAASVAFIILGSISSLLGLIFSEAANFSISVLIKMVYAFRAVPFSYFRVKSPPWIFIIGFYLFLFLFFNRNRIRIKGRYFLMAGLLIFNIFIWHRVFFEGQDFLRISFLDVGKGDSIFLEFPGGGTMLIDGGEGRSPDMGRLVVTRFLGFRGINKIDVVAATHPHTDHIGGLIAVLKNFKVRFFIDNGDRTSNLLSKECLKLVRQKRIKRFIVKNGDIVRGFEGADFLVLNPPFKKYDDLNNNSLVLKLEYKDFSALFCADIKEDAAKGLLLNHHADLPSMALKVPHHGGGLGGATDEFFEKVNPKMAVISLGKRDADEEVLSIFKGLRSEVYQTHRDGAIFLTEKKDGFHADTFLARKK